MICLESYGVRRAPIGGIVLGQNKAYRVLSMVDLGKDANIPTMFGAGRNQIFFCESTSYPEIGLVIVWGRDYRDYCFSYAERKYTANVRGIKKFLDDWKTEIYGDSA